MTHWRKTSGSDLGGNKHPTRSHARYQTPRNSILLDDDEPFDVDDTASSALKFLGALFILAICLVLTLSYVGAMAVPRLIELIK